MNAAFATGLSSLSRLVALTSLAAVLVGGATFAPFAPIAAPAAANAPICSQSGGDNVIDGVCQGTSVTPPNGRPTTGGNASTFCTAGTAAFLTVKTPLGEPIYTGNIFSEVGPWFEAWEAYANEAWTDGNINGASFFWTSSRVDVLAAAMSIAYSGGRWHLNPVPASSRQPRLNPSPRSKESPFYEVTSGVLGVKTGVTMGAVWTNDYPTVSGTGPMSGFNTLGTAEVMAAIKDRLATLAGPPGRPDTSYDIADHVWPDPATAVWPDYNPIHSPHVAAWIKNGLHSGEFALLGTTNHNYPAYIETEAPGATSWQPMAASGLDRVALPAGTKWRASIVIPNQTPQDGNADLQALYRGLLQVATDQINTPPTAPNEGAFRLPALMFPADPSQARAGNNGRWGTGTCGPDDVSIWGNDLIRNPAVKTADQCNAAKVNSPADLGPGRPINTYGACFLNWITFTQKPPVLKGWSVSSDARLAAVKTSFDSPTSPLNTTSAIIGQAVTIYPLAGTRALSAPQANFTLRNATGGALMTMNVTEVGITASLGDGKDKTFQSLLYAAAPTRDANGRATYQPFTLAFDRTPLSRIQDPYCAAAKTQAALQAKCGIGFTAKGEPFYQVRIHTWWSGFYEEGEGDASYLCGVFAASNPKTGWGCTDIDSSLVSRITPWTSSWVTAAGRVNHGFMPLGDDGKALAGFPNFGYASGSGSPVSPDNGFGSPMFDASHDTETIQFGATDAMQVFVSQVQPVG